MTAKIDRRQRMLQEGQALFLSQGYTATSVDAICAAAEVTKGAFFHHFSSKDEFASAVLAFTWQPVVDAHDAGVDAAAEDLLGRHIDFMARWIAEQGRLVPMLMQEVGVANPEIGAQIRGYFQTWMGYLDGFLEMVAADSGSQTDLAGIKHFIVATTEGIPVVMGQFGSAALDDAAGYLVQSVLRLLDARS